MSSTILELEDLQTGRRLPLPAGGAVLVGRSTEADLFLYDTTCSRQQFRIVAGGEGWYLEPLSRSVATYCNGHVVEEKLKLAAGMQITAGQSRFAILAPGSAGEGEAPYQSQATMLASISAAQHVAAEVTAPLPSLGDFVIGREPPAQLSLPHVAVSRQHAKISRREGVTYVRDLGSTNGTYVNGRRVVVPQRLVPGDTIGIGPYLMVYTGDALLSQRRANNLHLEAQQLSRWETDAAGNRKMLLCNVSLVFRPSEFVAILGPSGSGKSTLLSALSARRPANQGRVLINGIDLYRDYALVKNDLAAVPQHDILHEKLLLGDALRYTARMRLPSDTSPAEIEKQVASVVASVGLTAEQLHLPLERLSGGQRRRASLANELLANPSLLMLDEVTSGLDEHIDRELMRLFRQISDSGKTVVCVTHNLSSVAETCHLVVLLTHGGRLAFVGTPEEALDHFQVTQLGHIYPLLSDPALAQTWEERFKASTYYARYISSRSTPIGGPAKQAEVARERLGWQTRLRRVGRQLHLLTERYCRVLVADRLSLLLLLVQVGVVSLVVWLVFGNLEEAQYDDFRRASLSCSLLFVMGVSSFWFGCSNAVKEIVRERPILLKELQVNLEPVSYYASKFLVQAALAGAQATMLFLILWQACDPGTGIVRPLLVLWLTAISGVSVGLLLSVLAKTESVALTSVPLVLIPQIILTDIFIELEGLSCWLARLAVTNYWAYGALRDTLEPQLASQLNGPLPPPIGLFAALVAIGLQTGIAIVVAPLILHYRDRRGAWR